MTTSSRQYPRIPLNIPAEIEVQVRKAGKLSWSKLRVAMRTASCEGVGLKIMESGPNPITKNRKIVFRFKTGSSAIELPGRVAWSATGEGADLDLGVRLDLALAKAASRQVYSSWIVANIIGLRDATQKRV